MPRIMLSWAARVSVCLLIMHQLFLCVVATPDAPAVHPLCSAINCSWELLVWQIPWATEAAIWPVSGGLANTMGVLSWAE